MDELRFNKVFAGFLCAGLLIMAGVQIAHVLVPDQKLAQNSYVIEVPEATAVADAAPQDIGPEPILALLASADIAAGKKLAKKCTACHVFEAGGANKVGPALWSIVSKAKASADGFAYSAALAEFGGTWDYQSLNAFWRSQKPISAAQK